VPGAEWSATARPAVSYRSSHRPLLLAATASTRRSHTCDENVRRAPAGRSEASMPVKLTPISRVACGPNQNGAVAADPDAFLHLALVLALGHAFSFSAQKWHSRFVRISAGVAYRQLAFELAWS
jgi:hypothetical protein